MPGCVGRNWAMNVLPHSHAILGLRHARRIIGIHLNYIPGSLPAASGAGYTKLDDIEQQFLG